MNLPAFLGTLFLLLSPAVLRSQPCGQADPAYIRTATETGGIPMFLQRSEAAKSFQLVRESTRNNISTVLWATSLLDTQAQTFKVPVDSLTQRMTVAVSFDTEGSHAGMRSPSGINVEDKSINAEITDLHCGRIVTLVSPEKGEWHIELSGKGRFWMEAKAQSDMHLTTVEFVKIGGRPGHEGFFRIEGQPLAGTPATLEASASTAGARTVEFHFADEHGDPVQPVQMRATGGSREFIGTTNLPVGPFRVVLSGMDANGWPYQRFFAGLFHAESVEVAWTRTFDELVPGAARKAEFTVRNIGALRTFKVTVTDARRFVAKVEPSEITLGPGQAAAIAVDLMVPPGTAPGTSDDVVIVASATAGPDTSNSSVAHFSVGH